MGPILGEPPPGVYCRGNYDISVRKGGEGRGRCFMSREQPVLLPDTRGSILCSAIGNGSIWPEHRFEADCGERQVLDKILLYRGRRMGDKEKRERGLKSNFMHE